MKNKTYKPSDFARLINVSTRTLSRWAKSGLLKPFSTDNGIYYTHEQYLDYCIDVGKLSDDTKCKRLVTYDTNAFADKIQVSTRTLSRWDKSGQLPAHRTPTNRKYYTAEQYKAYMNMHDNVKSDIKKEDSD